jgi:hypothetical protein
MRQYGLQERIQNSSDSTANFYGLLRPGMKSFTLGLGSNQPLVQWVTGLLPGEKRPGCCLDHPPSRGPRLPLGLHGLLEGEFYLFCFSQAENR